MRSKRLKGLLMAVGLMIAIPVISQAIPGAKVLITDNPDHRVIEVDPITKNVIWEYGGTGTLNYPNEAIPLTNGNIMIADTYNGRVIKVTADTKEIVWEYGTINFRPVDVKRCVDYTLGYPRDTLLIVDGNSSNSRVIEITYPGKELVWELQALSVGTTGDYLFWEAEKRPGTGTPTYLITSRSHTGARNCVMMVQRTGAYHSIIWQYFGPANAQFIDPRDANWTPCNNVLITDPDSKRVIEVQPIGTSGGNIVWQYGPYGGYIPLEAIRIENMNTLIVGVAPPLPYAWDDNKDGKYPPQGGGYNYTDVREIQGTNTIVWSYTRWGTGTPYGTGTESAFVDVEEKGIINIAKVQYKDTEGRPMPSVFAGVVVPIFQPEVVWVGTPTIVATKTVEPKGSQTRGAILTYTIKLTNTGIGTATEVNVTDQVPPGTEFITGSARFVGPTPPGSSILFSHDGGQTYNASDTLPVTHIRWTIPEMGPGVTLTLEFRVQIK